MNEEKGVEQSSVRQRWFKIFNQTDGGQQGSLSIMGKKCAGMEKIGKDVLHSVCRQFTIIHD